MAFYKQDIVDINLNTGSIFRSFLNHSIGFKNDDADRFGIRCFRDGEPVDLSGASCQAVFMAPNGVNIALTSYGTVSGNVAYVTLPPACYDYEGQFCLSIQLVGGGVTGTMRIVDGMVVNTGASGAVAPTASVPTYQEIIAQYDAMVAATSAANLAIAETFDATKAYPAGKYVINEGHLYRLTADHAANVTWANTSKVATNFGDDLTELKSAITIPSTEYTAEQGTAADSSITYRVHFTIGYKINGHVTIKNIKAGTMFAVETYSDSSYTQRTSTTGWIYEGPYTFNVANACYITVVISKDNYTDISVSDVSGYYDVEYSKSIAEEVTEVKTETETNTIKIEVVSDATTTVVSDTEPIETVVNDAYLIALDGSLISYQSGWIVSDLIDISGYSKLRITASSGYNKLLYAFYNASQTFISGLSAGNDLNSIEDEFVTIPENAKYVRLSAYPGKTFNAVGYYNEHIANNALYDKWKTKTWVVIGDSLTSVNLTALKKYYDFVSNMTGIAVENYGISGTGYANPGNSTNFLTRAETIPTDADVYTIFGSFNDYEYSQAHSIPIGTATDTGTTTLCGYFNSTISALVSRNPLINLGIVSPCPWVSINEYNGAGNGFGKQYSDALKAVAERWSIPFLNLYEYSGLRPWDANFVAQAYTKDTLHGVHPDETGHAILATKFEAFLDELLMH